MKNRRELRNILVKPRVQLKYAFIFFAGGWLTLTLYFCLFLENMVQAMVSLSATYSIDPEISLILQSTLNRGLTVGLLIGGGMSIALLLMGAILSHRIFGPMVPTLKTLNELKKGNYSARINYRKQDEFQDVMDEINSLAEQLEARNKAR